MGVSLKDDSPELSFSLCDRLTCLCLYSGSSLLFKEPSEIDQHNCKHLVVRCVWYSAASNYSRAGNQPVLMKYIFFLNPSLLHLVFTVVWGTDRWGEH